MDKLDF